MSLFPEFVGPVVVRGGRVTTLPGGGRVTLDGYLPSRTCLACQHLNSAAEYIKTWRIGAGGRRFFDFGLRCLICAPPTQLFLPTDLRGMRPTSTYVGDDGRLVGWHQRMEGHLFGDVQRLELMAMRIEAGVLRPQPRFNRTTDARPTPYTPGIILDLRRTFYDWEVNLAVDRQHHRCTWCGLQFDDLHGPVGDHRLSWAMGGPTNAENCDALHAHCNAEKAAGRPQPNRRKRTGRPIERVRLAGAKV